MGVGAVQWVFSNTSIRTVLFFSPIVMIIIVLVVIIVADTDPRMNHRRQEIIPWKHLYIAATSVSCMENG